MAKTSSSGPPLARARFSPLELVSAIFIEVKYHSLFHSPGNKLRPTKALIFTFPMVKYLNIFFFQMVKYLILFFFEFMTRNFYLIIQKKG
jgi:hypothetical protein